MTKRKLIEPYSKPNKKMKLDHHYDIDIVTDMLCETSIDTENINKSISKLKSDNILMKKKINSYDNVIFDLEEKIIRLDNQVNLLCSVVNNNSNIIKPDSSTMSYIG